MLTIVFFARVKEELGCDQLEVEWDKSLGTPGAVKAHLCSRGDGRWREVLSEDNIICALNHSVAGDDAQVKDGDEIAFFPPVTGG